MTVEIGSCEWKQLIVDGARYFDIVLQEAAAGLFAAHARELQKWNRKINLTAITDPLEVAVKHYLDSIAPLAFFARPTCLLDIGSGGGFPGIPLKIMMPEMPAVLIDASRKKVSFLMHAGRLLGLDRLHAVHGRVEDLALRTNRRPGNRRPFSGTPLYGLPESFDLIVSRAAAPLDEFLTMGLPLLSEGGMMAAFKGRMDKEEIDIDRAGEAGLTVRVYRYELPYLHLQRSVVILERRSGHSGRPAGETT